MTKRNDDGTVPLKIDSVIMELSGKDYVDYMNNKEAAANIDKVRPALIRVAISLFFVGVGVGMLITTLIT